MMTRSQPHESTQKRGWLYSRKVPVAPLDQKDACAFVVPPGGAEETGAIGHKYGWLSSPHTHPQETFFKNQSITTLKTSQILMGYFEKQVFKEKTSNSLVPFLYSLSIPTWVNFRILKSHQVQNKGKEWIKMLSVFGNEYTTKSQELHCW